MSGTRMMVVFTALLVNVTASLLAAQICEFNGSCGAGEYCKKPDEACFSTGTCEPSPTTCQLILSPVCGCDQKTYSNSCFARTAGVSIARFGACDCRESSDCATDEFCEKEDGDCDGVGACTAKPVACSTDPDPVCGCDGVTYENVCLAAVAGASVAYEGACTTTCARNSECGTGQFCQKYAGHCQGLGSCQAKPLFCPITENLVCGCDGQTYTNACKASLAGVSVMSSGSCGDSCTSNTACPDWQYCDRIDGICGGAGVCRTMPTVGPTTFDPVCGCDGHSYDNASMAATAGTTVVAFDPCPIFGHGLEPGSTEGWSLTVQ